MDTAEPAIAAPASTAVTHSSPTPRTDRVAMVGFLRFLLLLEAAGGLAIAIILSIAAGEAGSSENALRFAAGGAFLFAIFAAVASRGARRRRPWAWTLAAFLQVIAAIGTGVAIFVTEWQPIYLAGFGAAVLVMLTLSATSVRRALGQD